MGERGEKGPPAGARAEPAIGTKLVATGEAGETGDSARGLPLLAGVPTPPLLSFL